MESNDDKLATKYLRALEDQQEAELKLELFFHKLFNIEEENRAQFIVVSADPYDWSLEIGLHGVDYKDFVLTPEQTQKILDLGCARFWINFYAYDSSKKLAEIYSGSGQLKIFE